jgi:hypothetical protein
MMAQNGPFERQDTPPHIANRSKHRKNPLLSTSEKSRVYHIEVWQRFAGTWATGATGQKPCATPAQPLLI